MPQKACERCIFHMKPYAFYSSSFIFGSFLVLKLVMCLSFEMPHFSIRKNFEMPHFFPFPKWDRKNGAFQIFLQQKNWTFRKKRHVTSFKTRNEPKMKLLELRAFQNKMHMASCEKYIFHMLFGAFHDTSCT